MTTSTDVPARVPVAVNGHGFMANPQIIRTTVPVTRAQADTSTEAGEQSLNPSGLWRRSQESWHHGAGQDFLDGKQGDEATDPHRFRSSKGIDPWTRGQVGLLNKTFPIWRSAATNLKLLYLTDSTQGSDFVYVADGTEVYWTFTPGSLLSYNTSSIETDTSGWQTGVWSAGVWGGGGNTTLSRSTAWAYSWAGAASLQLTPTAAGTITAGTATGTGGIPVEAGRRYIGGFAMKAAIAPGRDATIYFDWYNAAGAYLSTTTTAITFSDSNTTEIQTSLYDAISSPGAVAPANATYAALRLSFASVSGATDIHRIDGAFFGPFIDNLEPWAAANINAGQAAQTVMSVATDGYWIWAALGPSGLHRTAPPGQTSTADVPAAPVSGGINLVGYAAPFLLAAGSTVASTLTETLWLVNAPLTAPTLSVIKTHPNAGFVWTGIASGRNCVYAWGNSGGNGEVYKILFDANTGSLSTAASLATYLPDGETIHALAFYAGGVIMGTGKGVRIGTADGAGNIDYGPLVPTERPVRCLEPQDRYCWFGWSNYDSTSTGLGRIDLGFLTDTLTPAWASDLMAVPVSGATVQGDVLSVITYTPWQTLSNVGASRIFAVSGVGVFMEDYGIVASARVASGTLQTGTIRFSTSEPKTTRSVDLRHHALPAGSSVAVEMQREDSGTWTSLGSSSTTGSYGPATPVDAQSLAAEAMEFRLTLNRATAISTGPEMTRWTAKALPTPSTIDETFEIPLIMRARAKTGQGDGTPWDIDVATEIAYLKGLERARTLIDVQIGSETISSCYVAASKFDPDQWNDDRTVLEGIYTIQVQTARG